MQGDTVRPKTIVYFEWIMLGTFLFNTVRSYLDWDRAIGRQNVADVLYYGSLTIVIGSFVLFGVLTLLVSRRRSKIAMWVSIGLFAISFAVFVLDIVDDIIRAWLPSEHLMRALEHISQAAAYALLFTPSARRWMNREDEKEREAASSGARPHHFT
jgi:hypothetical protein